MPGFGRFDAYDEFGSRGPYAVWRARAGGDDGPGRAVVKTFLTQDMLADEAVVQRRAARFLASAELQKQLAGEGWAPIEDMGKTPTHVYYATAWYPMTLEKIIDARVIGGLAEDDPSQAARLLAELLSAATVGLERLAQSAKRGHGNLKPPNVLVRPRSEGSAELSGAAVALTDPAAPDAISGDGLADDQRAMAALLHLLVTGRPPPDGGAIQPGPEWSKLGVPGPGEEFRKLCEVLLNPQAGQMISPADVRTRLQACARAKVVSKRGKGPIIGAVAALLVLAGGAAVYFHPWDPGDGPRKTRPGEDPRGSDVAKWQTDKVALIDKASQALLGVRPCMTDAQLTKSDELAKKLEEARALAGTLAGERWPEPGTEGADVAMKAIGDRVDALEKDLKDETAAATALKVEVGDCSEDVDPRKPDRQSWLADSETRLKAALANAQAELGAELEAVPGGAAKAALDAQVQAVQTITHDVAEVRATEWPSTSGAQASDTAALKAARDARAQIRTRIVDLGNRATQATQACEKLARESKQRVGAYLDDVREKRGTVVTSEVLQEAFADAIGAIKGKNPSWAQASAQVRALSAWIGNVDKELTIPFEVPLGAGTEVDLVAAGKVLAAARDAAQRAVVKPLQDNGTIPSQGSDAALLTTKKTELTALAGRLRDSLVKAGQIEALLAQAAGYDEAIGGQSIKGLREAIEKAPEHTDLDAAVGKVMARAKGLGDAAGIADPAQARARLLASDGSNGAEAITLWRVGTKAPFPATPEELASAPTLWNDKVRPALAKLAKARRDELQAAGDAQVRKAWFDFVQDRAAGAPAALDAAFKAAASFGLGEQDLASLPPYARFNLERWKMLPEVEKAKAIADKQAQIRRLQELVVGLRAKATELGVASLPGVQDLFGSTKKLKPFIEGKFSNFEEVGPASPTLGAARWTMTGQDEDNGTWAEYSLDGQRVRFVRVGEGEDPASFVSTTEVTVNLFKGVMDKAAAWGEVEKSAMFPRNDQRKGPRAWVWDAAGKVMGLSQPAAGGDTNGHGWYRVLPGDINAPGGPAAPLFPPGKDPQPPTGDMPMNYVSGESAVAMAAIMGCRVPTVREWQAASRSGGGDANRRDAAWVEQYQHLRSVLSQAAEKDQGNLKNNLPWPATDAYSAPGKSKVVMDDGDAALPGSDGVIFFRAQAPGATSLQDVVGNVAELVLTDESEYARGPLPDRAGVLEAVRAKVKSADLRLIGASALSGPDVQPNEPYPARLAQYWSDVGFRLAFSTGGGAGGGGRPAERLAKLLGETTYLTKP